MQRHRIPNAHNTYPCMTFSSGDDPEDCGWVALSTARQAIVQAWPADHKRLTPASGWDFRSPFAAFSVQDVLLLAWRRVSQNLRRNNAWMRDGIAVEQQLAQWDEQVIAILALSESELEAELVLYILGTP